MTALTGIRIFLHLAFFVSIYCKEKTYLAKLGKKNHGEKVSLITTFQHGLKQKKMKELKIIPKKDGHKDKHQRLEDDDYSINIGAIGGGGLGSDAINVQDRPKVTNGNNDRSVNEVNIFTGGSQDLATLLAHANYLNGNYPHGFPHHVVPPVTPITPPTSNPAYCSNYESLSFGDRNVKSNKKFFLRCDHTSAHLLRPPKGEHPPDWQGEAWYRFTGAAGSQMASSPVSRPNCGTAIPSWLSGGHPSPGDGEVSRTVQFHPDGNIHTAIIRVFNCGAFYVYRLPNVPECWMGYCGVD